MCDYHVVYFDPFPVQRKFVTSDWSEVLELLDIHKNIIVHIHNSERNCDLCSCCTED